ncbi:Peptidoglycan/LPS O-acetylase OafA/YrhL, contains acyltransferase and SGNH-hydrolase domains [Leifsonia sp. 98AMF]|uniref:acyltransferase family protein n=1 Tax=Microbacteriaceae TaxID=85023 RepID=UPI00036F2872|nr:MULTISPECIES: acyltransferase [Microbacteriaceae]SDH18433.1 Peptidoglycan/LPS O-acetylase OafA/YrhL, contains acyltransferase and SGNH-hydrolase domains [Leifsonia sp. 197AMF]SDJ20081.1 Peptidoglycan/LPS O-acetylase OafA/YrhL, contains acyltransferase and SGNH-hydrolase domains [Leifsonia sp. 466MF]SDJ45654.1 Peptidoglycan/LPS O-acetylase OafA/YrhL, contains acyltransferase and SGNH-hydrolase domains [Leifsonia sp. 157MF]SDN41493.1 Peptidoglycan/LPS O-acetylase OafA/YrhL, contains acyltransf
MTSLDGLRGIAALIVLAHHASLLNPAISGAYVPVPGSSGPAAGSLAWWFTYTPLKLFTAGPEAVVVFFVLSGFVLSLPVLSPRAFDWMAYYPRRIVRIGLPVVCSLVFAAALALLVPQIVANAMSGWVATTSVPDLSVETFIGQLDPTRTYHLLNNPLWSIYWEVAFSVMLPLFLGLAVWLRRVWPLILLVATATVFLGVDSGADGLRYLPPFFLGVVAAVLLPRIRRLGATVSGWRLGWAVWLLALIGSALLLIAHWMVGPGVVPLALTALQPLAALGLLICCLEWRPLASLLSHQPFRWAGKISFSLYLVHVPIIVTLSYALRDWGPTKVAALAIPVALIVGTLFYQLVEKRSHTLSKLFGATVARAFERRSGEVAASAEPTAPAELPSRASR